MITICDRIVLVMLVMLACVSSIRAQDGDDEWEFSDIPVEDQALPYIGVGAGYNGMVSFMNYDELNAVSSRLGLGEFTSPMFLNGGGGFTAIYVVPNVRIGIYGAGGQKELSKTVQVSGQQYQRTMRLSMGLTAFQFDYAIPFTSSFNMFPGVMIGFNSYDLEISQSRSDTSGIDFNTLTDSLMFNGDNGANTSSFNHTTRISSGNVFLFPAINFEYALTQFFLVRGGIGYSFSLPVGDWTTPDGVTVNNVPKATAEGLMLQFGFFVGLFQQ